MTDWTSAGVPGVGVVEHPAFGGHAVRYRIYPLSNDPDEQVEQTIGFMRDWAVQDAGTPTVQEDAGEALKLGGGDPLLGVFNLVKGRFKFQNDSVTAGGLPDAFDQEMKESIVEVLIRPVDLSIMYRVSLRPIEDCDGYHAYAASLLTALGVDCAFCTVAADEREPDQYTHVYLVVYKDGERIALDCSHGEYVGWEVPNLFGKRKEWPVKRSKVFAWALVAGVVLAVWCNRRQLL